MTWRVTCLLIAVLPSLSCGGAAARTASDHARSQPQRGPDSATVGMDGEDGRSDLDSDHDGLKDAHDLCPQEAEDMDAFEDEDGCPDPDNDQDHVLDEDDQCPNDPEIYNGQNDEDGCPEGCVLFIAE